MNTQQEFINIMNTQNEIALATCTECGPNVRIVNFYYDMEQKVIRFTSFPGNNKVKEFAENDQAAFTTIPQQGNAHVRAQGRVRKSDTTIAQAAEHFIEKIPDYAEVIDQAGENLILFEILFDNAHVTLDMQNQDTLSLR